MLLLGVLLGLLGLLGLLVGLLAVVVEVKALGLMLLPIVVVVVVVGLFEASLCFCASTKARLSRSSCSRARFSRLSDSVFSRSSLANVAFIGEKRCPIKYIRYKLNLNYNSMTGARQIIVV